MPGLVTSLSSQLQAHTWYMVHGTYIPCTWYFREHGYATYKPWRSQHCLGPSMSVQHYSLLFCCYRDAKTTQHSQGTARNLFLGQGEQSGRFEFFQTDPRKYWSLNSEKGKLMVHEN